MTNKELKPWDGIVRPYICGYPKCDAGPFRTMKEFKQHWRGSHEGRMKAKCRGCPRIISLGGSIGREDPSDLYSHWEVCPGNYDDKLKEDLKTFPSRNERLRVSYESAGRNLRRKRKNSSNKERVWLR